MTKDKWSTLSMKDRAELIRLGVQNGVTSIEDIRETYNKYATGGPLKDSYNDPEEYYDYATAREIGEDVMYDKRTKHWMSRDPRTGMILKNPNHPTFNKSIEVDRNLGYDVYKDIETGRYYTLNDIDYISSKRKPFLHPVSEEFNKVNEYSKQDLKADIERYKRNWDDEFLDKVYDVISNEEAVGFPAKAIAYAIETESSFDPYASNSKTTASGPLQITRGTLQSIYGKSEGDKAYKQYRDRTRSNSDMSMDLDSLLRKTNRRIKSERGNMGYGRLKVNLLAPNSALDNPIKDYIYDTSLTPSQRSKLQRGVSTYRDLANIYDEEFNEARNKQ